MPFEDVSVRVCNSTEVIITPLNDAIRPQDLVNAKYPEKPPSNNSSLRDNIPAWKISEYKLDDRNINVHLQL